MDALTPPSPPPVPLPPAPDPVPATARENPYVCRGWPRVRILIGVWASFLLLTIPGRGSLRSYRRWRDGEADKPGPVLRIWSWGVVVTLVLGLLSALVVAGIVDLSHDATIWFLQAGGALLVWAAIGRQIYRRSPLPADDDMSFSAQSDRAKRQFIPVAAVSGAIALVIGLVSFLLGK